MVTIRVELFGSARMACGDRYIDVVLPEHARVRELTTILADRCPELLGKVLSQDGSELLESYTLNQNGAEFISGKELHLQDGDTLLLFSSQAGG